MDHWSKEGCVLLDANRYLVEGGSQTGGGAPHTATPPPTAAAALGEINRAFFFGMNANLSESYVYFPSNSSSLFQGVRFMRGEDG